MNLNKIYTILNDEYENELKLYASKHNNYYNWMLHTICIPMESLFFLIIICKLCQSSIIIIVISVIIAIYYVILAKPHSLSAAISYLMMCYIASSVMNFKNILIFAILMEIISWFIQVFIGHYYFNQNNPSMGDRLTLNSIILSVILSWDTSIFIENRKNNL